MSFDTPTLSGPPRLLLDLGEDRLEAAETDAVVHWMKAEGLAEPPPWVLRRSERIARQRRRFSLPATAQRLVATLAFDSRVQPQFVGLRAVPTRVRRLMFQAANVEVDLELTPGRVNDSVRLAGQVTAGGADPSGGFLRLSQGQAGGEWLARLDETGEFWVDSLAPGAYRLEVVLGNRVIEVPVLPI